MESFIIDKTGKLYDVSGVEHNKYFLQHIYKSIPLQTLVNDFDKNYKIYMNIFYNFFYDKRKQIKKFDSIEKIQKTFWITLCKSTEYEIFYYCVSNLLFITGRLQSKVLYLRVQNFKSFNDYQIKPILNLLKKCDEVSVDELSLEINNEDNYDIIYDSDYYTVNEFIEKL